MTAIRRRVCKMILTIPSQRAPSRRSAVPDVPSPGRRRWVRVQGHAARMSGINGDVVAVGVADRIGAVAGVEACGLAAAGCRCPRRYRRARAHRSTVHTRAPPSPPSRESLPRLPSVASIPHRSPLAFETDWSSAALWLPDDGRARSNTAPVPRRPGALGTSQGADGKRLSGFQERRFACARRVNRVRFHAPRGISRTQRQLSLTLSSNP